VLCHAKVSRASDGSASPEDADNRIVQSDDYLAVNLHSPNALRNNTSLRQPASANIACTCTMSSMNAFWNSFETLIGSGVEPRDLTFVQISLRGVIVFLVTLITMRLGHKRSLARKTPFDAVLLVILAAVLSRAINGSAAFFATLGGGVVLVVLHRLFAFLAFYSHGFGILVKGRPDLIVRDGQSDLAMMWRNHVSTHDLDEDMRLSAHTDDVSTIRVARVERSGDISFIKK
jgi:uncharacterized protein DUF421